MDGCPIYKPGETRNCEMNASQRNETVSFSEGEYGSDCANCCYKNLKATLNVESLKSRNYTPKYPADQGYCDGQPAENNDNPSIIN
jgi:hypothetical protein